MTKKRMQKFFESVAVLGCNKRRSSPESGGMKEKKTLFYINLDAAGKLFNLNRTEDTYLTHHISNTRQHHNNITCANYFQINIQILSHSIHHHIDHQLSALQKTIKQILHGQNLQFCQ